MKFVVERTKFDHAGPPCKEAFTEGDPKKYFIEISSLEQLIELSRELDEELILYTDHPRSEGLPVIEIYDYYRE